MADIGRPSSVRKHPERARIDRMLDDGVSYSTIVRTVGQVSTSGLSRYAISRKSALASLIENEPSVATVVGRLVEAADDARDLRRQARSTGAPMSRARAIKTETDVLSKLITELGIDALTVGEFIEQVNALVDALARFGNTNPDHARPLARLLTGNPATADLGTALLTRIENY